MKVKPAARRALAPQHTLAKGPILFVLFISFFLFFALSCPFSALSLSLSLIRYYMYLELRRAEILAAAAARAKHVFCQYSYCFAPLYMINGQAAIIQPASSPSNDRVFRAYTLYVYNILIQVLLYFSIFIMPLFSHRHYTIK